MKKIVILLLATLILSSSSVSAEPELDTDFKTFDFGWVPFNSTAVQYCVIRSIGTDTLIINDIISDCACLAMPLETQKLAPGDTMIIPIVFEFGNNPKRESHTCQVFTNESKVINGKPLRFKIEGISVVNPGSLRPVSAKPYRIEFSRLGKVDIDSVSFTLTNYSTRNLSLDLKSSPYLECEVSVPDSLSPNSSATGWVKITKAYIERDFLTSFTIQMTDALGYDRSMTVPIRRKTYSQ